MYVMVYTTIGYGVELIGATHSYRVYSYWLAIAIAIAMEPAL